jgi:SNF2 family DNA or RNA helicase
MSEFFVQRTREDAGITIPPPDIKIHYLDPDPIKYPDQYKAYRDLTEAAALVLKDGTAVDMLYILEIILRERQIVTWPAGVELKIKDPETKEILEVLKFDVYESQKLDAVEELCRELAEEGERTIVFSKFKAPLYELKSRLQKDYAVTTATGDDPRFHKEAVRADFDLKSAPANPKWNTCFATFDAFATGVNLNAARHVIMIDDEWSPGMEDQAIGRIDRLNSTDQANVHIFRVKSTIDIFMERLIELKRDLADGFETQISAKDIMRMLREES